MKTLIISSLFLLSFNIFAQIKVRKKTLNNNYFYTEKFYVLDTNRNIRHGEYFKISNDKTILENGTYEFGKKAGNWQFFTGKTNFLTYNFDTKKIIHYKSIEDSVIVKIGERYLKIFPEIPLLPISSLLEIISLVSGNPALVINYQYTQNLLIFIDKDGHFIEVKVNIPEKQETLPIKVTGIEKIEWIPPRIGSQTYESVFVLKLR